MPRVQRDLMFAGKGWSMQTTTRADETTPSHRRVQTDLKAGAAFLAVVIGGNLLWHASDAGIVAALAGR